MNRWIHRRTGPAGVREHAPETAEQRAARMAGIRRANLATIDDAERRGILAHADADDLRAEFVAPYEVNSGLEYDTPGTGLVPLPEEA